jgi:hypothetical protein
VKKSGAGAAPCILFLCALLSGLSPLGAQEDPAVPPDAGESPGGEAAGTADGAANGEAAGAAVGEAADSPVYVIRNIEFDTRGRSRPYALRYHGRLEEGEILRGREALEFYIRDRTQLLVNQRVLEKDLRISYTLGAPEPDGSIPVDLLVSTRDTWNIIVFPKPLWNSNDGFDLTLKARDYNFFGTMTPLRIDLGYQLNTRKESSFKFLIDSDIPFTALGFNWNINFDNEFNYSWQETLGYANTTALSMELPWQSTAFTFEAAHRINWYPRNSEWMEQDYGKYFEGLYNSVSFSVDWRIPTGLEVFDYGELSYTPRIVQQFNYRPGNWDSYEWENSRRSVSTGLEQRLGFGRIDWIGNFRRGLEASLNHSISYDYLRRGWNGDYSANYTGHFLFTDFFGIASRLRLRQWFGSSRPLNHEAGDALRGVKDSQIQANLMLSLNLEFPFRLWRARPSEWFDKPKLRIFNFELFVSPIMDFGLVYLEEATQTQKNLSAYYTAGMEALIFPDIMRSLYLCFSYALNLETVFKTGRLFPEGGSEFSIGIGHFF